MSRRPQNGSESTTPTSTKAPTNGNGSRKRDMDDFYTRKVETCDNRIKRLEAKIKEFEAGEQRMKERAASRLQQTNTNGGGSLSASGADGNNESYSPKKVIDKESEEKLVQRLTYIRDRESAANLLPIDASRPARQMWLRLKPNKEFEDDTEDGSIDVEAMVQRLGVDDIETRQGNVESKIEEMEANGVKEMWRQSVKQISIARRRRNAEDEIDEDEEDEELYVLGEDKMAALGTRLCNESLDHRKQVLAALEQKYYGADVNKSVEIEKSKERRAKAAGAEGGGETERPVSPKEIGARLHDASMAKKADTMAALEAKYLAPLNVMRTHEGALKPFPKLAKDRFDDMVNRLSTRK